MNKLRRIEIKRIISELQTLQKDVGDLLDEEQDCYDNMGDGLQCSAAGMDSENAIDSLDDAYDTIDSAIDLLNGIL